MKPYIYDQIYDLGRNLEAECRRLGDKQMRGFVGKNKNTE